LLIYNNLCDDTVYGYTVAGNNLNNFWSEVLDYFFIKSFAKTEPITLFERCLEACRKGFLPIGLQNDDIVVFRTTPEKIVIDIEREMKKRNDGWPFVIEL
jgi:hypothetical protein